MTEVMRRFCEINLGANVWENGDASTAMITTSEAQLSQRSLPRSARESYITLPTFIKID